MVEIACAKVAFHPEAFLRTRDSEILLFLVLFHGREASILYFGRPVKGRNVRR